METASKPALRAADRLRQSMATLAKLVDQTMNDVQSLDTEFQERIQHAAREAEASLEQQTAERLRIAVGETERVTRARVTEELQNRFNQEMTALRTKLTAERDQL